jgi:hypothetical protein
MFILCRYELTFTEAGYRDELTGENVLWAPAIMGP